MAGVSLAVEQRYREGEGEREGSDIYALGWAQLSGQVWGTAETQVSETK
jgi:hypothetical protein